jgi:formylglycine-generating enzyme required for sulfatase activity
MSNEEEQYNIAAIRSQLLRTFTTETLPRFCQDRPTFRPVVNRFGRPYRLGDMVDEVIDYCDRYLLFDDLLGEVEKLNPSQYERFGAELYVGAGVKRQLHEPAPPIPEILTITRPISLQLVRIQAGDFQMGSVVGRDKDVEDDELPPHTVHVPEFYIAKYPVTNLQYRAFVQASGHRAPLYWAGGTNPKGKQNHPVVEVSWKDALAFCAWLSRETGQSFRLPTEAEREKAAQGADGRIYPWGDEPPGQDRCNFGKNVRDTTVIGRYSPQGDSPYGCADMAGNVWEWTDSRWDRDSAQRVLRGGSWLNAREAARCALRLRNLPYLSDNHFGFRCVSPVPCADC